MGSGSICAGTGAGEDKNGSGGGGELCFIGENEMRCVELGGKDEWGLFVKSYVFGTPFAGFGEGTGDRLTGDGKEGRKEAPAPVDDAGRLKLIPYGGLYAELTARGVAEGLPLAG
jgi:hypothetical protein